MENNLNNREEVEVENQFLKLKMMLEKGAKMWFSPDLTPELENKFLKSIIEVEEEYDKKEARRNRRRSK